MSVSVKLDYWELIMCVQAGAMRRIENIVKNNPSLMPKENAWEADIEAAMAEYAVAKTINEVWYGKGSPRQMDVGRNNQVRHTLIPHGRLIVQKDDNEDNIYWLVTGCDGQYQVHGWISGKDAKKTEYWDNPRLDWPAFFVPQDKLNSVESYLGETNA